MEVKKIQYASYSLLPKAAPNRLSEKKPRPGALLQVWFNDLEHPGHSDLFPWPELGDFTLEQQLLSLKEIPYALAAASLTWARREAEALAKNEVLIPPIRIPSHLSLSAPASVPHGFSHAKLKMTASLCKQWSAVENLMQTHPSVRWRLDFNGLFSSWKEAELFWSKVKESERNRIDFLEDPMAPEMMADPELRQVFPTVRIALDRAPTPAALALADVWVVKPVTFCPAVLYAQAEAFPGEVVVTSSMDHPLGQLTALHAAQELRRRLGKRLGVAGLLTQDLYQTHPQSSWVTREGTALLSQGKGTGWGQGSALASLHWKDLP